MKNRKLHLNGYVLILFISLLFFSKGHAGLIVNCDGLTYDETAALVSTLTDLPVEGIIIGSPFKSFDNKKKDPFTYDYFDTGTKFQRGALETAMGSIASFTNLSRFLKEKKIALYSKINLFFQKDGFKRDFWNTTDFTADSFVYSDVYYLNVKNGGTRSKLQNITQFMFSLPVDKWVMDLRYLPGALGKDYEVFLKERSGDKFLIIRDGADERDTKISANDYYTLRTNIFLLPVPRFSKISAFSVRTDLIHFVDSDSLSMNNLAAAAYLMSRKVKIVIPYTLLNLFSSRMFNFFSRGSDFKVKIISDEKLIIYNKDKIAAFNFKDAFSVWETGNLTGGKGLFRSVFGSSVLNLKEGKMRFFMFPETISLWDTAPRGK